MSSGEKNKKSNKIAVNTRLLLTGRIEGIGRVAYEYLKRLVKLQPETEFHFFFDRKYDQKFIFSENIIPHIIYPPARHPILYLAWFECSLALAIARLNPNIFFSPDGYLSILLHKISDVPQIPIFHDLAFEHYPEAIKKIDAWHYRTFFPKYAQVASKIISVSESTKNDIINQYLIGAEKIFTLPNGCDFERFTLNESEKIRIRDEYSQGQEYFLYVGAVHPRKNIENMLQAFDIYRQMNPEKTTKLMLAGRLAWKTESILSVYNKMKFKTDVILTGYLDRYELIKIYASANALVYISKYEGFGLPILEAFSVGTPVITSNISSMPEVAGDAAVLVDPENIQAICHAFERLESDAQERKIIIDKGKIQLEKFSWDESAKNLSDIFCEYY